MTGICSPTHRESNLKRFFENVKPKKSYSSLKKSSLLRAYKGNLEKP
jgi:hypothetical protein